MKQVGRILLLTILSFFTIGYRAAGASGCDKYLLEVPREVVATLPWIELPRDLSMNPGELDRLVQAALGDNSSDPEHYVAITQGEFTRLLRAQKAGGLARFDLDRLRPDQLSQLRRVPAFLVGLAFTMIKYRSVLPQGLPQRLVSFFEVSRENNFDFERDVSLCGLSTNPLLSSQTKDVLGRLALTECGLRFRLNPFDSFRPVKFGTAIKALLAGSTGSLGAFFRTSKKIEINLYEGLMLFRMAGLINDGTSFWAELDGVLRHEGVHALVHAAGLDIRKAVDDLRPLIDAAVAAEKGKVLSRETIGKDLLILIGHLWFSSTDLSPRERANYVATEVRAVSGLVPDTELEWELANVLYAASDEASPVLKAEDLKFFTDRLDQSQALQLASTNPLLSDFEDTLHELLAHGAAGHTLRAELYHLRPEVTDLIRRTVLPRWRWYFRKPESFPNWMAP